MADGPGSISGRHSISRRTAAMRKAREEDAERIAREDEAITASGGQTRVLQSGRLSSRAPENLPGDSGFSRRERTVSGRTVVVRREDDRSGISASTRLSGRHAASVRVTGGDTIVRYSTGDMVIRRGARRARLRRQVIWAYALGYLALFSVYSWFLFTGTYTIIPEDFVRRAFSRRHSSDVLDLERAALEAMRGNRTPAEVRLAENLMFYDENQEAVRVTAGDRLTLVTAAKLGKAILDDWDREEGTRTFAGPIRLYKETYLASVRWPYWLTVYNSVGFFLLAALFLWRPVMNHLGTQGKKTAVALRNARRAREEAEEYRTKYRELSSSLAEKGERLETEIAARTEKERPAALERAQAEADSIAGGIEAALEEEVRKVNARLGAGAAIRACDAAHRILEQRLGQEEHDAAIAELTADIGAMRLALE